MTVFRMIMLTWPTCQLIRLCSFALALIVIRIDERSSSDSKARDWMILIILFLAIYPHEKKLIGGWFRKLREK